MALKGKRAVDAALQEADLARSQVSRVVNALQACYEERRPVMTPDECSELIESLIGAEDAIREAKARLEEGL